MTRPFSLESVSSTYFSAFSTEPICSSAFMTAVLAPPWSGPLSEPIAAVMALKTSVRLEAVARATKVLAFEPCSACSTSAVSMTLVAASVGTSPVSV